MIPTQIQSMSRTQPWLEVFSGVFALCVMVFCGLDVRNVCVTCVSSACYVCVMCVSARNECLNRAT